MQRARNWGVERAMTARSNTGHGCALPALTVDYADFTPADARARYAHQQFGRYLQGRVLDIGCRDATLHGLLPDCQYTGLDIVGQPDIWLNLETDLPLPFDDKAFDAVVCADVLEHVDSLYAAFDELLRVSARHVVVSLPNCWVAARVPIAKGSGDFLHSGLPVDPPTDRHKWFFSLSQARQFIHGRLARREDFEIVEECATEKPRLLIRRLLRRARDPDQARYLNRYAHTYWAVLARK